MISFIFTFYRFLRGIWTALRDPEFEALFTLVIVTLASGMFFYHSVEGWSWLDSLYFSVVTLTTVGYGDFAPHTVEGKIFTMVYLFVGIGILVAFINVVAQRTVDQSKENSILPWRKKKSS